MSALTMKPKRSWNCITTSDSSTSLNQLPNNAAPSDSPRSPVPALRHAANHLLLPAAVLSIQPPDLTTRSTDSGLDECHSETALSSPSATSRSSQEIDEEPPPGARLLPEGESDSEGPLDSPHSSALRRQLMRKGWSSDSGIVGTATPPVTHRGSGAKYKLVHEGEISVCRLNHARTLISKILSSKYLRRWETHRLILAEDQIYSKQPNGFMEQAVPYAQIEEVHAVSRWDAGEKYCIRIVIPDGSVLLQVANSYIRDQWCNSLQWKRAFFKYRKILLNSSRAEVVLKEIRSMIDLVSSTPLQDEAIYQTPLDIISEFLAKQMMTNQLDIPLSHDIIMALSPLLENSHPTTDISEFYSRFCKECPRSSIIVDQMTPVVRRILKHNMDFGNNPKMRVFIQDYFLALNCHNEGLKAVKDFIRNMHGLSSTCPHPRVLPNLVSVSVAAVHNLFEDQNCTYDDKNEVLRSAVEFQSRIACFIAVFVEISSFEDWRVSLAQLLQPIPFPGEAIGSDRFTQEFAGVIRNIGTDPRCEVHSCVLGVREHKDGWFHLYAPGGPASNIGESEGLLFTEVLRRLMGCCCRRKNFLLSQLDRIRAPCLLMALRENDACQDALCAMLELDVEKDRDYQLQIISTLQSTPSGKHKYAALCERQIALRELQQKGGPRKLTLPSKSTDADLAKLLSSGSFGNLECLSLAFTKVTSACADYLIKLPALKYLNLWSTQFGDQGLVLLTEHLHKLQVLNLCETPVTDKGLQSLAHLKNIKKLNLNSTQLSARTFASLKESLPTLVECDVRYTDAW